MTLMLVQDYILDTSETEYVEFIRASYLPLFPKLVVKAILIGEYKHCVWWSNNWCTTRLSRSIVTITINIQIFKPLFDFTSVRRKLSYLKFCIVW
jgi:hypothetical protein